MKTSKILDAARCQLRWLSVLPSQITRILSVAAIVAMTGNAQAQISATLTDIGFTAPTPGADDISQLIMPVGPGNPPGLNYYFDNGNAPGQIFTTGSNPNGYALTSLAMATAGGGGQLPAAGQAYWLRIFSVSGTTATLIATIKSQDNFLFGEYDWLQWTGFSVGLQPSSQYAYSIQRVTQGWENMGNVTGNPYAGGEAVSIPAAGGAIQYSTDHTYDASFDVGLVLATGIVANPPIATPTGAVQVGTTVAIKTAPAVGSGPFTYQWRTDGGNGGTLTNIPSATSTNLSVNTTGFAPGIYNYAVVVANGSGSVTSAVLSVSVFITSPATLVDSGTSLTARPRDISQMVGGGVTPDNGNSGGTFNYYLDNTGNCPGQTFTTGSNPLGYTLTDAKIKSGGGTSGSFGALQGFHLRVYLVNANTATLLATYTNTVATTFIYGDWVTWSGLSLNLKPNTTYAYTFVRDSSGWAGMALAAPGTDYLPGGQICCIPPNGGNITFFADGTHDAQFDLGLTWIGVSDPTPFANAPTATPSLISTVGTLVTMNETATGDAPLHYKWLTDGGSGGTLTNIPSTDVTNLVLNTTGWNPGSYRYSVIVTNAYGASTSAVVSLVLYLPETLVSLADIGAIDPLPVVDNDQAQLLGGGTPADLNNGVIYDTGRGNHPGQIFVTGNNPNGYSLTSLAVKTGASAGIPATGQAYQLRIYTYSGDVNEGSVALYAAYISTNNFSFTANDWVRWSGMNLSLKPNTAYVYSFGNGPGAAGANAVSFATGNPYANGQLAEIPNLGGSLAFVTTHDVDATFIAGLAVATYPKVSPGVISPAGAVYDGSTVTINAAVTGTGPFTYKWQTDGGSTGNMTDIPGATSVSLSVDTTGMNGLTSGYRLIVSNGAGSTTNEPVFMTINPPSAPFVVIGGDTTPTAAQSFIGGSVKFTAVMDGSSPIARQWQVDKGSGFVDVVGQTNSTLTLTNLLVSDSGSYRLHASNAIGSGDSTPAALTVFAQPPVSTTVNFQYISTSGNTGGVLPYTGTGIPGFSTGTYWNPVNAANNSSQIPTYADDGVTQSGASMTITRNGGWAYANPGPIMLLEAAPEARGTTPQNFTFTLANGIYNIVLYACNGSEAGTAQSSSATIFNINGVIKTTVATTDQSFIEGNNYVVYTNVVVTTGSLSGTYASGAGVTFGNLNGAQLKYLGTVNTTPPVITTQVSGGQLIISWPGHAGWTLQSQTNSIGAGLGTNWVDVAGSSSATQISVPINANNGSVFYRTILK